MFLRIAIDKLCAAPETTLREVVETIQCAERQIALIVDRQRRLLGTITDGDLRRANLGEVPMDAPASLVMHRAFVSAPAGSSREQVLALMKERLLRHVPLIEPDGVVVDLAWISEMLSEDDNLSAVVMVGGLGTRLRPLTDDVPKPMLPVGGRPLLEHIVAQLRKAGIKRIHLTTHYKPEAIEGHFGDGSAFGVELRYLHEREPLGTAGSLGLLGDTHEPLLVINGDVLTEVDFRGMLAFHREHGAELTIAIREQEQASAYGVVDTEGIEVRAIREKPVLRQKITTGIYLLDPSVLALIPKNSSLDMPTLITELIDRGRRVISFPVHEYWLDIGQPADYEKAKSDVRLGALPLHS